MYSYTQALGHMQIFAEEEKNRQACTCTRNRCRCETRTHLKRLSAWQHQRIRHTEDPLTIHKEDLHTISYTSIQHIYAEDPLTILFTNTQHIYTEDPLTQAYTNIQIYGTSSIYTEDPLTIPYTNIPMYSIFTQRTLLLYQCIIQIYKYTAHMLI
jgi:hypothetical protein